MVAAECNASLALPCFVHPSLLWAEVHCNDGILSLLSVSAAIFCWTLRRFCRIDRSLSRVLFSFAISFISLPSNAHYLSVDHRLLHLLGILNAKRCLHGLWWIFAIFTHSSQCTVIIVCKSISKRLWCRVIQKHFCTNETRQASLVSILLGCAPKCSNEVHSVY